MKRAFYHRDTSQQGSYLADLLLAKGYEVHGMIRRVSTVNTGQEGKFVIRCIEQA